MAQYQADVWLGSASGRQRVYVNSNTWNGAREQIKTIYHVQDGDIWNLCESREQSSSGSSSSVDGDAGVALVFGSIFLLILAWRYILLIVAIALIIWVIVKYVNKDN